jgi:hypothetical protein
MSLCATILTGVASSFVAALVFLGFMHCIRPKIQISTHIARRALAAGGHDYAIKVLNRSRRALLDLYPRLQIVHVTLPPGGHHLMTAESIELRRSHFFLLRGYRKSDRDAHYAVRFSTTEDLGGKWHDREHSYVRFIIKATDRISGVVDVFEMDYRGHEAIVDGQFMTGRSMEIVAGPPVAGPVQQPDRPA